MTLRWEVPDPEALRQLLGQPPRARGVRPAGRPAAQSHFRDVYYDTPDGELRARGARCRLRFAADGTASLTAWLPGGSGVDARFARRAVDAAAALAGDSVPARQLRALCDPARLAPWIERQVERARRAYRLTFPPVVACVLEGDVVTVRCGERVALLGELSLPSRPWGRAAAGRVAAALEETVALRRAGDDALQRALAALETAEGQSLARALRGEREIALVAVEHGRIGLSVAGTELRLPTARGSGEAACRAMLRRLVGSGEGQLRLLGVVPPPAGGDRVPIEVWAARRVSRDAVNGGPLQWFAPAELIARVGSPVLRDARTIAALTVAARSPLVPEWSGAAFETAEDADTDALARDSRVTLTDLRAAVLSTEARDPARLLPEQFFDAELSWLEFNARVLALAEDAHTPPAARLRFVAIFSTNLDQFVATQVAALKQLVALERGAGAQGTLDALAVRLRPLLARQSRVFAALALPLAAEGGTPTPSGVAVLHWSQLAPDLQAVLRARFADEVLPFLHPKALTRAPGHPFPLVADRRITLLVKLRERERGAAQYTLVEIPESVPRFVSVAAAFVPIEDVARANLDLLLPGRVIESAYAFRLTRSGDLQLDETSAANFLQAIEEELAQRPQQPVVRIEVEADTPAALQDLLQRELRFEESQRESALTPADVYPAPAPIDLGGLRMIASPPGIPDYPPLEPRLPFAPDRPILAQLDARDTLVHYPFDSFAESFERFIIEAAEDPEVQAIKLTVYRAGGQSPGGARLGDALRRAAAEGKDVAVLVELKARFDEARNIAWARSLERQGIHVVTGLVSLKTHAKLALVVGRGADGRARRYAYIGSGNFNPETARVYTDVGVFTADPRITGDVHALFNELTGSTRAPRARFEHLLVAPTNLLERLLALIDAETEAARAGRPARIRAKMNGLADSTVIQALYRASQAGVDIDLAVRGICTLRPCVPGLSERIRVVSMLGQFLEHARVYHFANGGYFIGSADWRPRNLRRRVEAVTPVYDAAVRAQLDALLTAELAREDAWVLAPDGSYERTWRERT